jgi:glycosyltransferase involved in cell wall biosynthesis
MEIVVFGQLPPKNEPDIGFRVHYMGHMHDDLSLSVLYSAADVMVIPSRQDNLPNTGVEAHACGLPVVAFNTGGLPDIVSHKISGYLASPFDTFDLANGIKWAVSDSARRSELSRSARLKAVNNWSYEVVGEMYAGAFRKALS